LPVEATKLVVRTLTVTGYGVAHGMAAREAVAVPCRRYGWSEIAGGAVVVCCTRVLVCGAFVSGAALFGDIDLANRRGEGGHADGPSMAGWWSVGRPDRGRGDCGRARHFRGRSSNPRSQHWSAGSEV